MHTGEIPFDFIQCDKEISLKVTFVDHPRIHIGEEPFKCDGCDASFSQISYTVKSPENTQWGEAI